MVRFESVKMAYSFPSHLACVCLCLAVTLTTSTASSSEYLTPGFRPPSVPLIVIDPYISVWSNNNYLYDDVPRHWSGPEITISGMIRIDESLFRFMSVDWLRLPWSHMEQVDLKVYPTQTKYTFEQDGIQLNLTFSTPAYAVPDQPPYLPLTYITYDVASIDGQNHKVQLYYDNTAEATVDDVTEVVESSRVEINGHEAMRIGAAQQRDVSEGSKIINWGYWYVVVPSEDRLSTSMTSMDTARRAFRNSVNGSMLPSDDVNHKRACSDEWPVLAVMWDLGVIQPDQRSVSKYITIVYDQIQSINYFGTPMIPYWRHLYITIKNLIAKTSYSDTMQMCDKLDGDVLTQLNKAGGGNLNYTTIAALAWRQAVGGTITVWNDVTQEVWMFMKEISSDGDVSTVDVIFPASPFFLWWDFKSIKLMLKPIMEYAINNTYLYGDGVLYNLPWAPHHLGHWPICNLLPGDQEQMPVEESGNMLLMIAASVLRDPSHDVSWLEPYWDVLITWGNFTVASLPDPGNQLCTDDFEGASPHNVNLAAKGIVGLGALSYLVRLGRPGMTYLADWYDQLNQEFVSYWHAHALDAGDGIVSHYRLQYNISNSWSLKYNLLYQKILNLENLFTDSDIEMELNFYMTQMNTYGMPLDSRANFTKADWLMWVAALGSEDQFNMITDRVYKFADETPDRYAFPDWYTTDAAKSLGNFYARPVMGGVFAKMLLTSMEQGSKYLHHPYGRESIL